jgi:hypothetical protein
MEDEGGCHPLKDLAIGFVESLEQWKQEFPDLWVLTSMAGNLSQVLVASAMHFPQLDGARHLPLLLWQQMTKYQFQSLLQFVALDPDTGYTLLRNATELTRDVAFLGTHPNDAERWYEARRRNRSDGRFRFDRSDPSQAYVHNLYKLSSNWGTHGHITGLSSSRPIGIGGFNDQIQIRQVSTAGRDEAVVIWLLGFVPMQRICATVFLSRATEEFRQFFDTLLGQSEVFQKAATGLRSIAAGDRL